MSHARWRIGLLLLALALAGCHRAAKPLVVDIDAEKTGVGEQSRRWLEAVNDRNFDDLERLYADDAVALYPQKPAIHDRDAIRKAWETAFEGTTMTIVTHELTVSQSGDVAYQHGVYEVRSRQVGGMLLSQGKWLQVWRKIKGEWQIVADMTNP
jgi:ketosteroid isomerase-like protein